MTSHPNRILTLVVSGIAVIAVVAGIVSATRDGSHYDRGSPEGVVQAYLSAVVDGDNQAAARYLAPDSACDINDLDRAGVPDGFSVDLRDSRVDGDTAQVVVDVVGTSGVVSAPAEQHTFRLTRDGGSWLITGTPWPMFECSEGR